MFDPVPEKIVAKLWPHQRKALSFAIGLLQVARASPCLIRMPTGTGKTGVIACLTVASNRGSSLVVTPWRGLRDQMLRDLERNFWLKLKLQRPEEKIEVVAMLPSTAEYLLNGKQRRVIVVTFATLNALRLENAELYRRLAAAVSLVVVDEGHYEPAVEWGKSVKGLKCRTILLTATPYRNDLKLFRIQNPAKFTHHYTHDQATKDGVIRPLEFAELDSPPDVPSLARAFAKTWKRLLKSKTLPSKDPRAIICCASHEDIRTAVEILRQEKIDAIGLHDQFEGAAEEYLDSRVPNPRLTKAKVWVHQHKLTEGLDDDRFCCGALFVRLRNDRKLIQQIGRILRTNPEDRKAPALLLAPGAYSGEEAWNSYLKFETQLQLFAPQHFRNVVDKLLRAQPEVEYFDRSFRKRFSPAILSSDPQVIIPPSVLVRRVRDEFKLGDYVEDCTDQINTTDAVILGRDATKPCILKAEYALWVYASVRNSRLLAKTSLYEVKLETHCVVRVGDLLFLTDSTGTYPVEYLDLHTIPVAPGTLTQFIDETFRPTYVSVASAIPYETVYRSADLRGQNLLKIPVSLTDRIQIWRSARASSPKLGRRYVGIESARVRSEITSESARNFSPERFLEWARSIAAILSSDARGNPLFERYMTVCAPPTNPVPRTISLDLFSSNLHLSLPNGSQCLLPTSSAVVHEKDVDSQIFGCDFPVEIVPIGPDAPQVLDFGEEEEESEGEAGEELNRAAGEAKSIGLHLKYDAKKTRFWFTKGKGLNVRVTLDEPDVPTKGLAEHLNQHQETILIGLEGGDIVYQGRNFYLIDYQYAEKALINLIQQPSAGGTYSSEKGETSEIEALKNSGAKKFPKRSLFRAIADWQLDLPFEPELLICADLGTECADFVAVNFGKRQMALIHAKEGASRSKEGGRYSKRISASAFHEVVAQAMKNLVYLTRTSDVPKGIDAWSQGKWNNTSVDRRIRSKKEIPANGTELWCRVRSEIIESTSPGLFVVLVTTGCCDAEAVREGVENVQKRTPELAQLIHLLGGLHAYARQHGVELLIRDLPFRDTRPKA